MLYCLHLGISYSHQVGIIDDWELSVQGWHNDDGHNRFGKNLSFGKDIQAYQYDFTVICLLLCYKTGKHSPHKSTQSSLYIFMDL